MFLYSIFYIFFQVNLSYDCFMNSLSRREEISTLSVSKKKIIFDIAVDEIERLILSSVLGPFYDSAEFAVVAQQRPSNGQCINDGNNKDRNNKPNLPKQKSLFLFKYSKTGTKTNNTENKSKRSKSRNPFSRMYSHSPQPPVPSLHHQQKTIPLSFGSKSMNIHNVPSNSSKDNKLIHIDTNIFNHKHKYEHDEDDDDDESNIVTVNDMDDDDDDIDDSSISEINNNDYDSDDDQPPYSIPPNEHKSASFKHPTPPIKLVINFIIYNVFCAGKHLFYFIDLHLFSHCFLKYMKYVNT